MKILKRILFALLGLVVLAAVGGWFYLHSKKPEYSRELTVAGLQKPVEVLFDMHGIPHIYAENEPDAYFALGYVHAQDRLFQMEMLRRLATGHLSEVVGDKALEVDKFFRTLSFREAAKRSVSEVYTDPAAPAVVAANAYVAGINRYLETGKTPLEFDLMGIPKTPFTFEDCLIVAGYMGFSFSEIFKVEPTCSLIAAKFGDEYLRDLVTGWDSSAVKIPVHVGQPVGEAMTKLSSALGEIEDFCRAIPPFHGSNSWVLGPSRTKNGKVIFENDTHIGFGQPSVFYEAHLNFGSQNLYGNFIAGTPVPVLGHTDAGAWGLTMFENDDVDFYREVPNPENPNQVKFRDGWENMEIRQETIEIKGGAQFVLPVKKTRHGYLMNGVAKQLDAENQPIAFWWTYYQRPDRSLLAFYNLTHAKDVRDAEQSARMLHAPGLNMMWGDAAGNIAWWAAGLLPKRPAHTRPYLILDGASGTDEIEGWLSFEQNPQCVNPPSGFVYSANNQPDRMGNDPLVPGYYVPEDRARRIAAVLAAPKNDWTTDDVRRLALDHTNPVAPGIVAEILKTIQPNTADATEQKALEIMQKWAGTHDLTDVAPTIYYRWMWRFYQNTFRDELGGEVLKTFTSSHTLKRTLAVLVKNDASRWWDDISTTDRKETRTEIFQKSWSEAIADLKAQLGTDATGWQWQKVHTLEHNHPLAVLPVVGQQFNVGPFPVPGGKETVNNLDFPLDSTGIYKVKYGPALRRVLDFAAPESAMSINPTGQSGNIGSPFYDDQARMYASGQFRPELTRRADVEKVQTARLVLKP